MFDSTALQHAILSRSFTILFDFSLEFCVLNGYSVGATANYYPIPNRASSGKPVLAFDSYW